jgi:hypothetical protein
VSYQQFGPNGFDFGLSEPKTGLGPGLLGDLKTLRALQAQMAEEGRELLARRRESKDYPPKVRPST